MGGNADFTSVRQEYFDSTGFERTNPPSALDILRSRRSSSRLEDPGPNANELQEILECASNPPDHGGLRPFEFIVCQGAAKVHLNSVFVQSLRQRCAQQNITPTPGQIEKESKKLSRAPLVVIVVCPVNAESHVPISEQLQSAGAAAFSLSLASYALGYGSIWRTGEVAHDPMIKAELGLSPTDEIVGYLYIGTPKGGVDYSIRPVESAPHIRYYQAKD